LKCTHSAFPCLLLAAALCTGQSLSQPQSPDPKDNPVPQERNSPLAPALSSESTETASPDAPSPQQSSPPGQSGTSSTSSNTQQSDAKSAGATTAPSGQQQPKRILGIMPNFRAVSAGAIPPPPTPKQAFIIATQNSFDYSSFIFVGITSLLAEGTNAHSQLGKGIAGFGRYYWRGFVDKTDGNYLVIFALPTIFHQDERYYAMGKGGFWKRGFYAASRIAVTPDYHGHNSFNVSELLGRGIAQGISVAYYPSKSRTAGALASKYGYAIGRDGSPTYSANSGRISLPTCCTGICNRVAYDPT
jgi:hypothetical protein